MPRSDVEVAIIQPMVATLPAPLHIRGDPAAIEALLNVYRRALDRFDRAVLDKAWQKAAEEQDFWMWPMPEALVKAAEHFHNLAHPFDPRESDAWVERANDAAHAYTKRFMQTTTAAVRSREGGYEAELKGYVREAAWVQAQLIEGREGVGYSSHVLFGPQPDRKEMAEFFEKARAQANTGHIRLYVPAAKIGVWQAGVQADGRGR